jgi:hypothetical protein
LFFAATLFAISFSFTGHRYAVDDRRPPPDEPDAARSCAGQAKGFTRLVDTANLSA